MLSLGERSGALQAKWLIPNIKNTATVIAIIRHTQRSPLHLPMGQHAYFAVFYRRRRARVVRYGYLGQTSDNRDRAFAYIFYL